VSRVPLLGHYYPLLFPTVPESEEAQDGIEAGLEDAAEADGY